MNRKYVTKIFDIRNESAKDIDDWLNSFEVEGVNEAEYNWQVQFSHVLQGNCVLITVSIWDRRPPKSS